MQTIAITRRARLRCEATIPHTPAEGSFMETHTRHTYVRTDVTLTGTRHIFACRACGHERVWGAS